MTQKATSAEGLPPELRVEAGIATITLRRPELANRLEVDDLRTIRDQIVAVNAMDEVLVLRLCSTGKYFCSGFNVARVGERGAAGEQRVSFEELVNCLEAARPVSIAAINGGVYGGATDLALACDFRIGVPSVDMFVPAARLGLHFYRGGLERYVARLGLDTAKRIFLRCEKLNAQSMLDCGFLTEMADGPEALQNQLDTLSAELAALAPLAMLGMKKHLNAIARGELKTEELARDIARAAASEDIKEGGTAFREKRRPRFKGR